MTISFRTVTEDDFAILHRWLNQDHVLEFFQYNPITLEKVVEKYQSRSRKDHPTRMHIALLNGKEFGYLQSYLVRDYPNFSREIQEHRGFSLDFYIGRTDHLGRGLGPQMIGSYISYLSKNEFPEERFCFICHRQDNAKGIKTSKRAGLKEVRKVIEEGYPSIVLVKEL